MAERRRRHRVAVILAATVMALAACSSVPDGGAPVTVRSVPPAGTAEEESEVRVQAPGPVPGNSPVQVVRGFFNAAVSGADVHAVARGFLTSEANRVWEDDGPVRVFRLREIRALAPDAVRVVGTTVGVVGVDGALTPSDEPVELTLRLRRSGGSWQIDTPPPGVYLQDVYFTQVYVPYSVYFLAAGARRLVPDVRYVDRSLGNAEPSQLVRLLLGGPSRWLAPGVRTAFPPGTGLRGNVVRDGDVLVVDLTAEAEYAGAGDRALLCAQLVWTLRQFPESGVRVEVEGRPFTAPSAGAVQDVAQWAGLNPASPVHEVPAYHLDRGSVRVLVPGTDSGLRAGAAFGGTEARSGVRDAAVTTDGSSIALVKAAPGGRQRLLVGPSAGMVSARATAYRFGRPTWGARTDAVLVAADGRRLLLVPHAGPALTVAAAGLRPYLGQGQDIQAVRLAPDGVRLALVVGSGPGATLLAGVLRGVGGRAPTVVGLRAVAAGLADVTDVGWSGEGTLVTVGSEGGSAVIWEVSADGATRTTWSRSGLPARPPNRLAAAPPDRVLLDVGGVTYQRYGDSWGPPLPDAAAGGAPFYPG